MSEINMLLNRLAAFRRFRGPATDWLLPLHSSIAHTEQKKVFLRPPKGIRKVISCDIYIYSVIYILLLFLSSLLAFESVAVSYSVCSQCANL